MLTVAPPTVLCEIAPASEVGRRRLTTLLKMMAKTYSRIWPANEGPVQDFGGLLTFAVKLELLLSLFDGDASLWRRYLIDRGTFQQIEADLPFVLWIEEESRREQNLRARLMKLGSSDE